MKRHRQKQTTDDKRPDNAPYGWLLTLRALSAAAIILKQEQRMSALAVLCVLAEYTDQEGICRVGQDTIAARIGVTRQAVNRELKYLETNGFINSEAPKSGVTRRYALDREDVARERFNEDAVNIRRRAKAAKRAEDREKGATSKRCGSEKYEPAISAGCTFGSVSGQLPRSRKRTGDVQLSGIADVQRPELAPGATPRGCTPCNVQSLHEETSSESDIREPQKRGPLPVPPSGSGADAASEVPTPGVRVRHQKFGLGVVAEADEARLTVDFEKAGRKLVLSTFVEIVSAEPDQPSAAYKSRKAFTPSAHV
jgi:DNA-binding MarR family transcriptional regulator